MVVESALRSTPCQAKDMVGVKPSTSSGDFNTSSHQAPAFAQHTSSSFEGGTAALQTPDAGRHSTPQHMPSSQSTKHLYTVGSSGKSLPPPLRPARGDGSEEGTDGLLDEDGQKAESGEVRTEELLGQSLVRGEVAQERGDREVKDCGHDSPSPPLQRGGYERNNDQGNMDLGHKDQGQKDQGNNDPLEMTSLEMKLELLSLQRRHSAVRCQIFLDHLEEHVKAATQISQQGGRIRKCSSVQAFSLGASPSSSSSSPVRGDRRRAPGYRRNGSLRHKLGHVGSPGRATPRGHLFASSGFHNLESPKDCLFEALYNQM